MSTVSWRSHGPSADSRMLVPSLSVVIPVFNEEDGIGLTLGRLEAVRDRLKEVGFQSVEVIVVDDGSQDTTSAIVKEYSSVRLIEHGRNKGYGAAIQAGFLSAQGDYLAFLDADGTYPPESLPALCEAALTRQFDIVVGSRRSGAATSMPLSRRLGNTMWSGLVSLSGRGRVEDPASGMRVLRRSALSRLYPLPPGLNFTPVMSTRALHEGMRVHEMAIPYDERLGDSKLSVVKDGTRFLTAILWTALQYNPGRMIAMAGSVLLSVAFLIGLGLLMLRVQGVSQLGPRGVFLVFSALAAGVTGASLLSLGVMFQYLVTLFHDREDREGSFDGGFGARICGHFVWIGPGGVVLGCLLAVVSLGSSLGGWPISRLWFWLFLSALILLVGVQLTIAWLVMGVVKALRDRDALRSGR